MLCVSATSYAQNTKHSIGDQEKTLAQSLEQSTKHAQNKQTFDLKYLLKQGETIRWNVEQIAATDAAIAGHKEKSSIRSRSTIAWKVISVDSNGNMTFQNSLESAKEWQKVGDNEPIRYDSQSDEDIPDVFRSTAEKIGKPIATITIDPKGNVVNRIDNFQTAEFGMGRVTIPLPVEPVRVGGQWHTPEELTARHADRRLKRIKTRILYTLREVADGVATIAFRREILTPIKDPKIKSQLQQKLNQGTIHFDMAHGRVIARRVEWDEKVQGFEGPDSYLHYVGTYTMKIQEGPSSNTIPASATKPGDQNSQNRSSQIIKPRDGKPIIRH